MYISFGAKIPVGYCKIYDKKTRSYPMATIYEIDCKDKSDIAYIKNIDGNWNYKFFIEQGMIQKYKDLNSGALTPKLLSFLEQDKYYSMESPYGGVICLCETENKRGNTDIKFIESSPFKYFKYAGSAMLAFIAKKLSGSKEKLTVSNPSRNAIKYYSKVCKFNKDREQTGFELDTKDKDGFVSRIERKTKGEIIIPLLK